MGRHRSQEQSEIIIKFMRQHKDIATGDVKREERENAEKLWKSLTNELNAKGPPMKECGEWKKAWTDWRKSCLKKLALPADGVREISDYEQAIIEICGMTPTSIREYESDENSEESTTSSDTPLKKTTTINENSKDECLLMLDPLKQENFDLSEACTSEVQFHNIENVGNNVQNSLRKKYHRSPEQSKILLNFMQNHKKIAMGTLKQKDDKKIKILWKKLADELNVWGPPTKSVRAWKKAWTDWKMFCRKKLAVKDAKGHTRALTNQERIIIKLCEMEKSSNNEGVEDELDELETSCNNEGVDDEVGDMERSCNNDAIQDDVEDSVSISSDTPLKRKSLLLGVTNNETVKQPKINEENSNDFYDEDFINEDLDESSLHEINHAHTPSSTKMEKSLAEIRTGVVSIQSSLQEICKLMTEQNQELRRFTAESRRHHFVMEKEMIERKRERRN